VTQQIAVVSRRDPRLGIEKLVEHLYTTAYFAPSPTPSWHAVPYLHTRLKDASTRFGR
jgi:hypothetical protein